MKHVHFLRAGFFLVFFPVSILMAQITPPSAAVSPFTKGNWWFNAGNNFWFDQDKVKSNDTDDGKENSYGLNQSLYYFPVDHFGIGINYQSSRDNENRNSYDRITSSNIVYLNGMYGTSVNDKLNLYGKLGVGFGGERSKYTAGTYSNDYQYTDFGYNMAVGAPYPLCQESAFTFTPEAGWSYKQSKSDYSTEKTSGFYFQSQFTASLPCDDYAHDCGEVDDYDDDWYDAGSNFVGGNTYFRFFTGQTTSEYSGGDMNTYEKNYNYFSLNAEYMRYVSHNLAVGAGFDTYLSATNDKQHSTKQSQSSWMFTPKVQANLPVDGKWNNSYGYFGGGFGLSKTKSESSSSSSTSNYIHTDVNLGIGYNIFFARSFALSPYLGYDWNSSKEKSSNYKTSYHGFEGGFYIRHFFKAGETRQAQDKCPPNQ